MRARIVKCDDEDSVIMSASVNLSTHTVPCCCLCLSSTSADHRKRKRLRIDTCVEAREVLVSVWPFFLQTMLQDHAAVLCIACQRDLCRIAKLSLLPRESLASETTERRTRLNR